jgi:hypothetical protein
LQISANLVIYVVWHLKEYLSNSYAVLNLDESIFGGEGEGFVHNVGKIFRLEK